MRERGRRVQCEGLRKDGKTRCSKWAVWRPEALAKFGKTDHPLAGRLCHQHLVGPEEWRATQRRGGHRRLVRFHEQHRAGIAALEREKERREAERRRAVARLKPPEPPEDILVISREFSSLDEDEVDRAEAQERADRERAGARERIALGRYQRRQLSREYAGA
jgi:hypothetical protein